MTVEPPIRPRKAPRQDRSRATVDAILDATEILLVQHGYEGVSTNKVAAAAGVSVGSLYQYFPNKDALVAAVIQRHSDRCFGRLGTRLADLASADAERVARVMIELLVEMKLVERPLQRALLSVPRSGPLGDVIGTTERLEQVLCLYLEAHRREIAPTAPKLAAFVLIRTGGAIVDSIVLEDQGEAEAAAIVDEYTQMVLRYLFPGGRRR
jgi:AcrR family transcriptional regulator